MGESIHVPLSSLLPGAAASAKENPLASNPLASPGRTFYIETFGCQMNDHDSEKVAGVLLRRGYRQDIFAGRRSPGVLQYVQHPR